MSNEEIQVIRTGSCPSLSGSSTIAYEVGSQGESRYVRLSGNSAGGLFCGEWVPLAEAWRLLEGSARITGRALQPLYAGRSANSPGFLLACLQHEGIVGSAAVPPEPLRKAARGKKSRDEGKS